MTFSIVIPFKQRCPYQCNLTSNGTKSVCLSVRHVCDFMLVNGKQYMLYSNFKWIVTCIPWTLSMSSMRWLLPVALYSYKHIPFNTRRILCRLLKLVYYVYRLNAIINIEMRCHWKRRYNDKPFTKLDSIYATQHTNTPYSSSQQYVQNIDF